jgi:N,N'-diacetyllegionaminate synthase
MVEAIEIGGRRVGSGCPCFIVAEAGVNHNGNLEVAIQLVDEAAKAGVDAVKFQTFKADRLVTKTAVKAEYQLEVTGDDESQYEMLRRLELSADAHRQLMRRCKKRGILFMSTPFDKESADFLAELGVSVFKIASGEITNFPLLNHVANKGKPMIISTGMADLDEVKAAVNTVKESGNRQCVLLHCVSNYPADPEDINLRAMQTMKEIFGVPVGYSDHTLGIEVALAAVALGACVIEKHFTLDKNLTGPDHQASIEPNELASLVKGIRIVEDSLGHGRKEPAASEANTAEVARKSLVAAQDIPADTVLTKELITIKRPGTGLPPSLHSYLIGRTARRFIPAGTPFTLEMIA